MRSLRKVEHNARIASRRFSKGIVCRIIQGKPLLQYMQASGLVPRGLEFQENFELAYSPRRGRVFVIPLHDYNQFLTIAAEAGYGKVSDSLGNTPRVASANEDDPDAARLRSVFEYERNLRSKDILYNFLKDHMVVVAINVGNIPKDGLLSMLSKVDVIIDTVDTGQDCRGDFVSKTEKYSNENRSWADNDKGR